MPRDETSRIRYVAPRTKIVLPHALAFERRIAAAFERLRIGHLARRLAPDAIARIGCIQTTADLGCATGSLVAEAGAPLRIGRSIRYLRRAASPFPDTPCRPAQERLRLLC